MSRALVEEERTILKLLAQAHYQFSGLPRQEEDWAEVQYHAEFRKHKENAAELIKGRGYWTPPEPAVSSPELEQPIPDILPEEGL